MVCACILFTVIMYTAAYINKAIKEDNVDNSKIKNVHAQDLHIETPQETKTTEEIEEERTAVEEKETKEVVATFSDMYTTTSLNIRIGASSDSDIYTTVGINTKLEVADNFDMNNWKRIKYDGKELYVNGKYLSDKPVEVKKEVKKSSNVSARKSSNKLIGKFKITHYAEHNITATGTTPKVGRTIAVDPKVIPYGSRVVINGNTYIAEDCGGAIKGNIIDIFVGSTEEAYQKGVYYTNVYWG